MCLVLIDVDVYKTKFDARLARPVTAVVACLARSCTHRSPSPLSHALLYIGAINLGLHGSALCVVAILSLIHRHYFCVFIIRLS